MVGVDVLHHFYGLQGSGKSWGIVVFAQDLHIKKKRKVYANFWIEFGELIDMSELLNFKYNDCVILLDETYGLADSHKTSKVNDNIAEVIHQSRKRDVDVFFATQLQGDLYKRVRDSAHRKVLCINNGTEEEPVLVYYVMNQYEEILNVIGFDTDIVKSAYHLYDTNEVIMPMYLHSGMTLENITKIYEDCPTKKSFVTALSDENKFIAKVLCEAIYDFMKVGKYDRVKKLLRVEQLD
jgi:hypothetical protein